MFFVIGPVDGESMDLDNPGGFAIKSQGLVKNRLFYSFLI